MQNFFQELQWRGFIHSHTQGVEEHLAKHSVAGYVGFDPTASSLHVGSLLPIMGLVHLQRGGHIPIAIAGGGTGMIGDPSGKVQERKLLSKEDIEANLEGIKKQLAQFLDFNAKTNPAKLVNNADWLTKLSMMEFLRDVGKHFSVNEMLARDSVKNRIEQEQGMSFTEFSYSLLQAFDFLELYDRHKCTLQMGGSDQWGNIVAGVDLIRRLRSVEAHGIVFHLITTSTGIKFGKTESGTIWLDANRTSPYKFYQYWFNTDDRDVSKYLRFFTLLPKEKIDELENSLKTSPEKREAQKVLAQEVTRTVHGESALAQTMKASQIFFGGEITGVSESELLDIFSDVPSNQISKDQLRSDGLPLVDLVIHAGVAKSKGEARRAIEGGGIYINNIRCGDVARKVTMNDTIHGKFLVLRKGGRNYFLVRVR
ncbi:MAG: tyrosine--tRNA ligase [Ignavibacteriae bacterium]|nr:tyrosine--tRNA ligase [Ignavibacteria bacterium]MBI3364806.1 tyrosine--tRNA ligase [Ignavibacteriota bacterium]